MSASFDANIKSPTSLRLQVSENGQRNMIDQKVLVDTDPNTSGMQKIVIQDMNFFYGVSQALFKVNLTIPENRVTAFIGPSGCGKSTLLRCLNRLNDLVDGARLEGKILLDGQNIYESLVDVTDLRTKVGMVFQKVNPFQNLSIKMWRMAHFCKKSVAESGWMKLWNRAFKEPDYGMK